MPLDLSSLPLESIRAVCARRGIRRLSLFGSALREDFSPQSDVDVLVEFQPGVQIGLMGFQAIEDELSTLLGRKVDLNTRGFLSDAFVQEVEREARLLYVAA